MQWNKYGKLVAGFGVVAIIAALVLLETSVISLDPKSSAQPIATAAQSSLRAIGSPTGYSTAYAPLPSVDAIRSSLPMTKQLAKTIDDCRFSRIEDSVSNRPIGQDPFLTLGTTSTCSNLFDAYGKVLDVALSKLKDSPDPIERGYYYDANYDQIAEAATPLRFLQEPNAPARQEYEKLTDDHFEDVIRDLDKCNEDSIIRAHLSLKLTSPKYDNPNVRFFMSYILVVHDYTSVVFVDAMRAAAEEVAAEKVDRIKTAVFKGMETCGTGSLGAQMASFAAQR